MALIYEFIDEDGERYGGILASEPDGPVFRRPYVPASGPFTGRHLELVIGSIEHNPSEVAITVGRRYHLTIDVADLLELTPEDPAKS